MARAAVIEHPSLSGHTDLDMGMFQSQADFVYDESYAVAAVTGIGAGKTRAGAIKALNYLLAHPGAVGMITAPTFPMLDRAVVPTIRDVWPAEVFKKWPDEKEVRDIELINGSRVYL